MADIFAVVPLVVPQEAVLALFPNGDLPLDIALQQTSRWNKPGVAGTSITLSYYFSNDAPTIYTQTSHGYADGTAVAWDGSRIATIESTLAAYSSVANITFNRVNSPTEANISFFLSSSLTVSGFAYYPSTERDKGSRQGDVYFRADHFPETNPNHYLAYHEIGHALGIAHAFDTDNKPTIEDFDLIGGRHISVVDNRTVQKPYYPFITPTQYGYSSIFNPTGLSLLDIRALQLLYGANTSTASGNTTYTPINNPNIYQTIWDGGGHDTIDLSNQQNPSYLSLVPGVYSTIGLRDPFGSVPEYVKSWALGKQPDPAKWNDGANSLTIAFGVIVEDAAGSSASDVIVGNEYANSLNGRAGDDKLDGGAGNDTLIGGGGADQLNGNAGLDLALLSGPRSDYAIGRGSSNAWTITDRVSSNGNDGTDTTVDVERLEFTDINVALDTTGNAGKVARLLSAVFGVESLKNKAYAGIGLSLLDQGMSYATLAGVALNKTGKTDSLEIIEMLWLNVMGTGISATDKAHFSGLLATGTTLADLVLVAADSAANQIQIELAGINAMGLDYLPFSG